MKRIPIAVAVTAAMFSLSAVAGGDKQAQAGDKQADKQQSSTMSQEKKSDSGMSAGAGASAPGSESKSTSAKSESKSSTQAQAQSPEIVKQAQEKLNVTADGKVGPETQKAVKEFQTSKGLEATGRLDEKTITALGVSESASAGGSAPSSSTAPSSSSSGSAASGGSAAAGGSAASGSTTEQKPQQAPAPASTKQQ